VPLDSNFRAGACFRQPQEGRTHTRSLPLIVAVSLVSGGALAVSSGAANAEVDPLLVGRWKLDLPGLDIYWQVRADGSYRYFGNNARPFEHWGTIEASAGHWSTQWAGGKDGGTYTVDDDSWQSSGNAGIGNWRRVWKPGAGGSQGTCPLIDIAEAEQFFASAARVRGDANRCHFEVTGVGWSDGISIDLVSSASDRFWIVRKNAATAGHLIVDVPGLADSAYIDGDTLYILKGGRYAVLNAGLYPEHPDAVSNEALIKLGRSVVTHF
jgi:hypothetical protein